jgi:hypothetical protein
MRGEIGIMHDLRRKERSTADHAATSGQPPILQLHHDHHFSHLATALNFSQTLHSQALVHEEQISSMRIAQSPPLSCAPPYHHPLLCVSRTMRGLHTAFSESEHAFSFAAALRIRLQYADARACTLTNSFGISDCRL